MGTPQLINVDVMRTPSPETTPLSSYARYAAEEEEALPSPLPVSSPPTVDVDSATEGCGALRPHPSHMECRMLCLSLFRFFTLHATFFRLDTPAAGAFCPKHVYPRWSRW